MPNSKEKINLTPKDFSFICPLSTDELTPIEGGYHCDSCEKKVYDVSHMTKSEFKTLQEKTKDLCISFKKVTTVAVTLGASSWITASDDNATQTPFSTSNSKVKTIHHTAGKVIKRIPKENTFKLGKVKITPQNTNNVKKNSTALMGFAMPPEDNTENLAQIIVDNKETNTTNDLHPNSKIENIFGLEKIFQPQDTNKTNTINALTPPVKCDIETSLEGDNIVELD